MKFKSIIIVAMALSLAACNNTKKEETNYKPYFFAMNFETSDTTMNTMDIRKKLLKEILAERRIIIHD